MTKYIAAVLVSMSLFSCVTQKKAVETTKPNEVVVVTNPNDSDKVKTTNFLAKVPKKMDFSQLKIKGNAELEIETTVPKLGVTLYFEKNTKIWTNVTVLGITTARGLITKDSVKGFEKLQKTYIKSNFSALQDIIGLDFLDFQNTENLLLGKLFMPIDATNFTYTSTNTIHTLTSIKPIEIKSGKSKGTYKTTLSFDKNFELQTVFLSDEKTKNSWKIEYSNREIIAGKNFPKKVKIFINDTKNKVITLDYNTFDFEKMSTSFDIPNNYTKRKI